MHAGVNDVYTFVVPLLSFKFLICWHANNEALTQFKILVGYEPFSIQSLLAIQTISCPQIMSSRLYQSHDLDAIIWTIYTNVQQPFSPKAIALTDV